MLVKAEDFAALGRTQALATYIPFAMVSGGEIFESLEMANPDARKDRDRRVLALILETFSLYTSFCISTKP